MIFTVLHAGGKFEQGNYKTAGGLHGVGASVVNALSRELVATVRRDGAQYEMSFKQGKPVAPLKKTGAARGSGTTVFFRPDPVIFPKVEFEAQIIRDRLEVASFLHKGVKVSFDDQTTNTKHTFQHEEGLVDYLKKILAERSSKPVHEAPFALAKENGVRLEAVLQWTESTDEHLRSYVNGIPTGSGGTHEAGFRAGVGKAVRNFIETHNLSPKGVTLTAEDIREGLIGVLSVFIAEPQFQGQTKDRLNNPEMASAVDGFVRPALEHWLNTNISVAEGIVARIILAARAREASRAAQADVVRKGPTAGRVNLPGKLADCTQPGSITSELFVVEGDSAGGSAKQGRDRARQAILPLRGKVLNTEGIADRQGAREQGAGRPGHGARLRRGQELRPVAHALRQGHHPGRRRLRRPPHRHAAAHVLLPPHAAAHRRRQGLPGAAAALPHRHRQRDVLGARRRPQSADPEAEEPGRATRDHALQGPGRDDAEGAVGDHAQPAHAPAAAGRRVGPAADRPRDQRAHGQGRLGPVPLHHGAGRRRSRNSTSKRSSAMKFARGKPSELRRCRNEEKFLLRDVLAPLRFARRAGGSCKAPFRVQRHIQPPFAENAKSERPPA